MFATGEAEEGFQGVGGASCGDDCVDSAELPVPFHVYGTGSVYHA